MLEIYYCKSEDDLRRVAIHIFQSESMYTSIEDGIQKARIYCCDWKPEECDGCEDCDLEGCLLYDHIDDNNVHKHIELCVDDIEYPCVVCVTDSEIDDEQVTICSIAEAKLNTKYGFK